jgi:dynein heavy chain
VVHPYTPSSELLRVLERCVTSGSPLLLDNVGERLEPLLIPVLRRDIQTKGGVQQLQLGDRTVDYDPTFRLYLTTRLGNPHFSPETCVLVNLLDFSANQVTLNY